MTRVYRKYFYDNSIIPSRDMKILVNAHFIENKCYKCP